MTTFGCRWKKIRRYVLLSRSPMANTALRPVAVYLYGGAFTKGTAVMIDYGGNFASRSDVVVVTVNYRLGALGFLSPGKLTIGNYGIRDQVISQQ